MGRRERIVFNSIARSEHPSVGEAGGKFFRSAANCTSSGRLVLNPFDVSFNSIPAFRFHKKNLVTFLVGKAVYLLL